MTIRPPYVAGHFYPGQKDKLRQFLSHSIDFQSIKIPAKAVMVPHAGYVYSGGTAAKTYSRVELSRTILLIGPNHTGLGRPFSLMPSGLWQTPLGEVPIDEELGTLLSQSPLLEEDEEAHSYEHSLEVQLPFLQYLKPDIRIVPLTVGTLDLGQLTEAGCFIGKILSSLKERVLLIISSDMNHYEDEKSTQEKDKRALSALLKLDALKFADVIKHYDISMCGFAPAYLALSAFKVLGVSKATVVEHTTSAKVSGDYDRVVGYAGVIFD